MTEEFPQEFFIELVSNENFLGRLTVNKVSASFTCEIDIVQRESRKIFHHIKILYNLPDKFEAIESGRQRLGQFVQKKKII